MKKKKTEMTEAPIDLDALALKLREATETLNRAKSEKAAADAAFSDAYHSEWRRVAAEKRREMEAAQLAAAVPIALDEYRLLCLVPGGIKTAECRLFGNIVRGWTLLFRDHESKQTRRLDVDDKFPRHPTAFRRLLNSLRLTLPEDHGSGGYPEPIDRVFQAAAVCGFDPESVLADLDDSGADWHTIRAVFARYGGSDGGARITLPEGLSALRDSYPPRIVTTKSNGLKRTAVDRPVINYVDEAAWNVVASKKENNKRRNAAIAEWRNEYREAIAALREIVEEIKSAA